MKKKIKLRDLTEEQYKTWRKENCTGANCNTCPFLRSVCSLEEFFWGKNKDLYVGKFLNQEIEIEVPDLLTSKEKEYLEAVIRPFKDKVISISKNEFCTNRGYIYIGIKDYTPNLDYVKLPKFEKNKYYKGLEIDKEYTLKDLELFKE